MCRSRVEKGNLTRFVVSGGMLRLDLLQRLPGRGAYLCRQCVPGRDALKRVVTAFRGEVRGAALGMREFLDGTLAESGKEQKLLEALADLVRERPEKKKETGPLIERFTRRRS